MNVLRRVKKPAAKISAASPARRRRAAARRAALLVVLILPTLATSARPQERAAQIEKQIEKQEKIYGRRGAEVPRGYITNRGLSKYAELLPAGFCSALGGLGSSDRWLDIGAG